MMADTAYPRDLFRTGKAYTITEAARLAGTNYQNVRRWLLGYEAPGHRKEPVFGEKPTGRERPMLSFLELVEVAVAAEFRRPNGEKSPVPLDRIRRAHAYARRELGLPYPFASLPIRSEGGHILHDFVVQEPGPGTLVLSLNGQWTLPIPVQAELENVTFGDEWATEWHPFGRQVPIVVNPRIAAGSPVIAGSGVTIRTVRDRFDAGDDIDYLAADYNITPHDIQQAIRHAAA
jgi:uncharacterized protein (DUF433 family)